MIRKITIILVITTFLFFRFYKIDTSLFFYNEMGRDALVLQNWKTSGKPPLLGPQNSAIAFNQSPFYFYLLYPLFLVTNGSPYSALFTNAFIYLGIFLLLIKFSQQTKYFWSVIISFLLISIHPQQIIQSRYIWNPSFCTAFLLLGFWSLILKKYFWSGLGFAASLAVSVSTFPTLALTIVASLPIVKKGIVKLISSLAGWIFIFYLPILFFEIKHNFLITKNIFARGSTHQEGFSNLAQLMRISDYVFSISPTVLITLLLLLVVILIYAFKLKAKYLCFSSLLLLFHIIFNIFFPITLERHFIFGMVTLLAITISLLPKKMSIIALAICSVNYLQGKNFMTYFSNAPRTFSQMQSCWENICQENSEPVYVSVESSYHPFHNGPEHRYVGIASGCKVLNIEEDNTTSNTMLVVGDGAIYNPEKTDYYELGLFGSSQLIKTYNCQNNYQVYLLKRK